MHERTIDDLVGHVLANIVDRGGTHYADCEFDGQRHLVCVARTLAREVERLRAEVERLRAEVARCADDFNFQSSELAELRDALIEVARVYRAASRDRYCDDDWCTKCFGDGQHEAGCPVGDALAALPLEVRAAIEAGKPAGGDA